MYNKILIGQNKQSKQNNVCNYKGKFKLTWLSWWLSASCFHSLWMASLILSWRVVKAWSKMLKHPSEHRVRHCWEFMNVWKCERSYQRPSASAHVWINTKRFRRHSRYYSSNMLSRCLWGKKQERVTTLKSVWTWNQAVNSFVKRILHSVLLLRKQYLSIAWEIPSASHLFCFLGEPFHAWSRYTTPQPTANWDAVKLGN